jgi:hypothetical protein
MVTDTTPLAINEDALPLLAGECGPRRVSVYLGASAPAKLAARYARLGYRTISDHPAMLRHFDFASVVTGDNLLAFVCSDDDLLAAAYVHAELRGDRRVLIHKGYVSSGEQRGLAKVLIAALHAADAHRRGEWSDGEAVARILRDGSINEASSTPFADVGFHGVRNYWTRIGPADVHLAPFAEKRPDGLWVGCHLMAGSAAKIAVRAGDILADWTLSRGSRHGQSAGTPN